MICKQYRFLWEEGGIPYCNTPMFTQSHPIQLYKLKYFTFKHFTKLLLLQVDFVSVITSVTKETRC